MEYQHIIDRAVELTSLYGLKIVAAIVVFIIGRWVAKAIRSGIKKALIKKNVDPTIISFSVSLIYIMLIVFVALASLGQLGVQTTSFIAIIGAAGLAVGLALKDSLSNFASGFMLIMFRPFKVGDFVEAAGVSGSVEEIHIFTTTLKTTDNKIIIIPNAKLTDDIITNYSTRDTRRIDMVFGIGYGDDIDKAKAILKDIMHKDSRILDDPPETIGLSELADSSVNFVVRPWVKTGDYWNVLFDTNESVKKRFDAEGISIPFPQQDVHIHHVKGDTE